MSNNVPVFSLAYTSVRPQIMPLVVDMWNTRSVLKTQEWCIGVDEENAEVLAAANAIALKHPNVKVVVNKGPKTCVAGWNAAAEQTTGKVIIMVADDFRPPQNWDQLLLSVEPSGWEDREHVLKVEDGYVHNIFVLSILTRKRYQKYGYVFYPKYQSLFCDTEFGEVATRDGVVIDANHLLFEHLHPDCQKRSRDGNDLVHASPERWQTGEMLFKFRKAQGFPVDDGPNAGKAEAAANAAMTDVRKVSTRNNSSRYVAYMQVTKDDLCLLDVCKRLIDEGVSDFCFCEPDAYWSGEAIEPEHAGEIAAVIEVLRGLGQTVHHKMFKVDNYRMKDDTRILVETRVRNDSLSWIRSLGYQHLLVVDGDELWMRGALNIVRAYVEQGHKVLSLKMIPVIGHPGYPVEGAGDVAVAYVGPGINFKVCRSPYVQQTIIQIPLIYHFTGTRKDMEEIYKKHRRGGHYDDPDYDFEGWLKDTLPLIKPGMVNAHMYKPYQIWPRVRAWRPDELAQMPLSVRPHLGSES